MLCLEFTGRCIAFVFHSKSNHYFKYIKISALALLKMVMHARSGGNLEVMGLLIGKVSGRTNEVDRATGLIANRGSGHCH